MQALLALLAAWSWGSGNFAMGSAGRRSSPRVIVLVGFSTGLVGALIFLVIQRPALSATSFFWGAGAGVTQGLGWLLFSRALVRGHMSIIAPLTSASVTTSLYVIGILTGNRVTPVSVTGAVCAISAIALLSRRKSAASSAETGTDPIIKIRARGGPRTTPTKVEGTGVAYALGAGVMFTLQSLALNQAGTKSSSLVVVGAGLGVVVLLLLTLTSHPLPKSDFIAGGSQAALGGFCIFVGDVSYLYALNRGPLTTASVLSGIHPVFTVVLARLFLREGVDKIQLFGVGLAIVGASLIASG